MSQSKLRFNILLIIVKYRNNLENSLTQLFNYIYSLFGISCGRVNDIYIATSLLHLVFCNTNRHYYMIDAVPLLFTRGPVFNINTSLFGVTF